LFKTQGVSWVISMYICTIIGSAPVFSSF
jgi:hypothetical protein